MSAQALHSPPDSNAPRGAVSRRIQLFRWISAAAIALAGACFSESATTESCPTGQRGCPCGGDATCNDALVCESSIDRCVVDNCTPGSELCVCSDGSCLTGLVCDDGLCTAPGGTQGTAASASASGDPTVAGTGTTGADASETGPGTTAPADTGSDSTGGAPHCGKCLYEAAHGDLCLLQRNACDASAKCASIATCQEMGGDNCCAAGSDAERSLWNAVVACAAQQCDDACEAASETLRC